MNRLTQQQGASLLNILFFVAVLGFFVLFGMKTIPHYINDWTFSDVISSVKSEMSSDVTLNEIKAKIQKRMQMNQIDNIDLDSALTVNEKKGNQSTIDIAYTVKEDFFHNIQLVMNFKHSIDL